MHVVLESLDAGAVRAVWCDDAGTPAEELELDRDELPELVAETEAEESPRWVWSDTAGWYPPLLAAGVRVDRALDLRLCRRILRLAEGAAGTPIATLPRDAWDAPPPPAAQGGGLFELERGAPPGDAVAELARQRAAVAASREPGVLALLLAAESVGSLVAAEMSHAGLPWSAERHRAILEDLLGSRDGGSRPDRMEALAQRIRDELGAPGLNPDSAPALLKALQVAGLGVQSTSRWELQEQRHPVVAPLLEYKKLHRMLTANGWHWLDEWVHDGRFRPVYVVGGVVTGRWASDGGGALQLPHSIRGAVVPDPGWKLVVADAAQLEPRVLAAMSGDAAMARAGQAVDMYEGIVRSGAVADRQEAKYGMLGAIYGGTTGASARVLPRLTRAFPAAMGLVERAARDGEQDRRVRTWLGRTSPRRGEGAADGPAAYDETRTDAERRRAQQDARSWGRFTRNFVVQGTAAEWAMCWMGALRSRLWSMGEREAPAGAVEPFARRPHLVFFLHDELIVHAPEELAEEVAEAMRVSAAQAGRMLFPAAGVEFPVQVAVVDRYADAK
ncbi:bifunctional 3'-5' exonuclease/DNA polymerase [Homoserinibacter sp. YIM 151385]|uniref:bifunctional 3'-5' exonuclease/DNA polymerase n=1 Tax=Homoserinibacter sp. YIM 151385 TaxID=2985506 RepID=UPI0022F0EBAF|nr:bifunctional 3'-5' exonuclease/DNA polymerase [Homoserinibacter sp. YIM 151385]WBU38451.1 bifunctional 3'-5' exonuclease/DNA polymerase [Homoserinibacter sp. YIM 151385]